MTNDELNDFLRIFHQLKEKSIDPRYGFDDDWDIFIKKILALSPKSYGTKIQNRIIEKNNLVHVKANEDLGDFKIENQYFEIKTSLITVTNKSANITGIRPWQNVNGYYVFIIDANDYNKITTYTFRFTNEEMKKELVTLKAIPVNGTKKANKENTKSALRFGISLKSDNFRRWQKNFLFVTIEDDIVKEL